jgi:riboflavin synthase
MFTGIVTATGTVLHNRPRDGGAQIEVQCPYSDIEQGESIAVDGACLTVESTTRHSFNVHVVPTTLGRTRFGEYAPGRKVNLERALKVGERLSGHLVQGHVDGVGTVLAVKENADTWLLDLRVPAEIARLSVPLGSITVDGVSLTVNAKPASDVIQISLVPFTLQHTTLSERRVGDAVHIEADTIGKYVAALLEEQRER